MPISEQIEAILDATQGHDPEEVVKFLRPALELINKFINRSATQVSTARRLRRIKRQAEAYDARMVASSRGERR